MGPVNDDPQQLVPLLARQNGAPEFMRTLDEELLPLHHYLLILVITRVETRAKQHRVGLVELIVVHLEARQDILDAAVAHRPNQT